MAKSFPGLKKEVKKAKQSELEYQTALQAARMSKERLRKKENHLKFCNGGLIQQVGLHELPLVLLLGALLLLKQMLENPELKAQALRLGERAMAEQAAKKRKEREAQEVFIAFDSPPPENLLATLKALKLRFNPRNKEWRGPANYTFLKRAVMGFGWDKHVLRSGYVQ